MLWLTARIWANGSDVHGQSAHRAVRRNTDAARDAYEQRVRIVVDQIRGASFGVAFLNLLDTVSHPIVIVPTSVRDNAFAGPIDERAAFPAGDVLRDSDGRIVRGGAVQGTGGGSVVRVLFNGTAVLGALPQVVLLHELTHAWRQARGRLRNQPLTAVSRSMRPADNLAFATFEEWIAILVQNTWSSETGARELRAVHFERGILQALTINDMDSPFRGLPGGSAMPRPDAEFATRYADLFAALRREEPELYALLQRARAHFNPTLRDAESRAAAAAH